MPDAYPDVQGYCPACHGQSLFLGADGYVTCARLECPEPDAATRVLERRSDEVEVREIPTWHPVCPEGRHVNHPGYTCDDADNLAAAGRAFLDSAARALAEIADIPAALRGPNWKAQQ